VVDALFAPGTGAVVWGGIRPADLLTAMDMIGAANVKASSKTDNDGFQPRRKCRGYLLF